MMMSEILFIIGFVTLTLGGFILGANLAFIPTKTEQKLSEEKIKKENKFEKFGEYNG